MAKARQRIPAGYHTVVPHITVKNGSRAMDFYVQAFGAEKVSHNTIPGGDKLMHGEIRIGDSHIMLHDEFPDHGALSPLSLDGTPVALHLWVEDADRVFEQAVAAGCSVEMPMADQFWGDRYGVLKCPYGHKWSVGHRVEDLTREEIDRRGAEWAKQNMGS